MLIFVIIKQDGVRQLKSNIWTYSANNDIDHTLNHKAQFPKSLARDHILTWSNINDVVLDPFMGSGTTAEQSILHNRKYIGYEISKEYCSIIKQRIDSISRFDCKICYGLGFTDTGKRCGCNPTNFEKVEERGLFSFTDDTQKDD